MKCYNCNYEISPDSEFCINCGVKIKDIKHCTNCGTKLKDGQKFCTNCGFSSVSVQKANETHQQINNNDFNEPIQEEIEQPQSNLQPAENHTEKAQIEPVVCHNEDNNSSKNDKPNTKTKSLTFLWLYAIGGFLLFGIGLGLIIMDLFDLSVVEFDSKKQSKMLAKALLGVVAGIVITIKYLREIYKLKKSNNENGSSHKDDSGQVQQKKSSKLPIIITIAVLFVGGIGAYLLFYSNSFTNGAFDYYADESIGMADTTASAAIEEVTPKWENDVTAFDAKGPVKQIYGYIDENFSTLLKNDYAEFDESGRCLNLSESNFRRDENGYLCNNDPGYNFEYNSNGFIKIIRMTGCGAAGFSTEYTYDNNNLLKRCRYVLYSGYWKNEDEFVEDNEETTYTYRYVKIDHHGNWLERYCNNVLEQRKIIYWGEEETTIPKSSNLSFFELKGNVKRVEGDITRPGCLNFSQSCFAEFDINGRCTNLSDNCKCDGDRIIGLSYEEFYGEYTEKYEYNDNDHIHKSFTEAIGSKVSTFEYDAEGKLILESCITEGSEEGEDYRYVEKFSYKYITCDASGNWTKREKICSYTEGDGYHKVGDTEIQTRTITYY